MNLQFAWVGPPPVNFTYYLAAFFALFAFVALGLRRAKANDGWLIEGSFLFAAALALFACRWPTFLIPIAMNPDEGGLTAYGLKTTVDLIPWRGFDGGTSGPLNGYILALPALFGGPISFLSARIFGASLMLLTTFALYFAVKWSYGPNVARLSTVPPLVLLALTVDYDFLHFSSEYFPIFLTTVALAASVYLVKAGDSIRGRIIAAAIIGLCLGSVPFAKLQAIPLAATIGLFATWSIFSSWKHSKKEAQLVALVLLAALCTVPAVIAISLWWTGEWYNAVYSYIRGNLAYVAQGTQEDAKQLFFLSVAIYAAFLVSSLVFFLVGAIALVAGQQSRTRPLLSATLVFAVLLLLASLFAIYRPHRIFPHYLLLSIIPLSWCSAHALGLVTDTTFGRNRETLSAVLFLAVFLVPIFSVAAAIPNTFVRDIRSNLAHGGMQPALTIARYIKPREPLLVWGWFPELYTHTGTIMATRDAETSRQIVNDAHTNHYRRRFMADFYKRTPVVFVDAVHPHSFFWTDRAIAAHEVFPELKAEIRANYELKEHYLGVRIYVRRSENGAAQAGSFTFEANAEPDIATFDNPSEQSARFRFSAKGTWSCAPGGAQVGPAGTDAPAPDNFYLPGARSFSLIAKREDGTFEYVGESSELTLRPGEVASFLMNDISGTAGDNTGSLEIAWAKE